MKRNKLLSILTSVSMLCGMTSAPVFAETTEVKDAAAVAASVRAYLEENGYTGEALENAMAVYETGAEYAQDDYMLGSSGFYAADDQGSDLLMYETLITCSYYISRYMDGVNDDYFRIAVNLDDRTGDYAVDPNLGDQVEVTETYVDYDLSRLDDKEYMRRTGSEFVFDNVDIELSDWEPIYLLTYPISKYIFSVSPRDSIREGNGHMDAAYPDVYHLIIESYCYVMGDVNHDGMVNPIDYTVGLRILAGEYPSGNLIRTLFKKSADMDMNGEVTVSDLEAIFDLSYYTEALTENYAYADRLTEEDEKAVARYFADNGYMYVDDIKDAMYIYLEGKAAAATGGTTDTPVTGDVNCDGAVNAIDYTEMLRYLTGQEADVYEVSILDVNSDGVCDIADAKAIPALSAYSAIDNESVLYGDVNIDGMVSMLDVVYMQKFITNAISINEYQMNCIDCCADGIINGNDVTAVIRYLVESIPELPYIPE